MSIFFRYKQRWPTGGQRLYIIGWKYFTDIRHIVKIHV